MGWVPGKISNGNVNTISTPVPAQEKETPVQVAKADYGTFSTILKDLSTVLKITGLVIAQQFYSLVGNKEESTILKHSIQHYQSDLAGNKVNSLFKDKILVESRNVIERNQLKTQEQRQKLIDDTVNLTKAINPALNNQNVSQKAPFEKNTPLKNLIMANANGVDLLKKIEREARGGICAGACIDFASKILNKTLNKTNLIDVATNYKSGIPVAGVANQVAYECFDKINAKHNYEASVDMAYKKGELSQNDVNLIKTILGSNIYNLRSDIVKLNKFFESLKGLSEKHKADSNKVENWVKSFLTEGLKPINATLEKPTKATEKIINLFKNIKEFFVTPKAIPKNLSTHYIDYSLVNDQQRIGRVANKKGLSLGDPLISGNDRLKSNANLLKEVIPSLKDGVYSFNFKTGDGGHATLLIKSENTYHLWDPNYGLVKCEPKPDEFLADYLEKMYTKPNKIIAGQEAGTNHYIEMSAYTKL